jgi:hypothetical protein
VQPHARLCPCRPGRSRATSRAQAATWAWAKKVPPRLGMMAARSSGVVRFHPTVTRQPRRDKTPSWLAVSPETLAIFHFCLHLLSRRTRRSCGDLHRRQGNGRADARASSSPTASFLSFLPSRVSRSDIISRRLKTVPVAELATGIMAPPCCPSPAHACGRSHARRRRMASRWCPLPPSPIGERAVA